MKSTKIGKEAARLSRVSKAASLPIVITWPFDMADYTQGRRDIPQLERKRERKRTERHAGR